MTCESALELLLDAEPSEFSANERTPLGDHLRGCVRCRRVAAQLMQDTQGLALAMAAVPVRRPAIRVRQLTLIPAVALAAIVLAVMLRANPGAPVIAPVAKELVATVDASPVAARRESPEAPAARPRAAQRVRRESRAFARAVPLAPVRLVSTTVSEVPPAVETSGVSVTPPAGTRATVMHTSNPKLVVVWLY